MKYHLGRRNNKLPGRQAPMGVLALTCMDLSLSLQKKQEFIYITGMTFAPKEPKMKTISHILVPLVDKLILLKMGIFINSPLFINQSKLQVHLDVLIEIILFLVQITKYCLISVNKKCFFSKLNCLSYLNPINNLALCDMHNWYKDVLQHHWIVCWEFKPESANQTTQICTVIQRLFSLTYTSKINTQHHYSLLVYSSPFKIGLIALHRNFKTSIPIAKYFTESSLNTPPACKTEVWINRIFLKKMMTSIIGQSA
ncbi:hypothetical protein VP01_1483g7 [Puccinia sorghi]|uniref:Uncharacterized protein n=1 Tax=Puccinia sorghi TaxID=27349 RepID=A0A0L6VK41_9BASI|nr:hypothetical protein VP01_1483g7 [Puccinia sorghi]